MFLLAIFGWFFLESFQSFFDFCCMVPVLVGVVGMVIGLAIVGGYFATNRGEEEEEIKEAGDARSHGWRWEWENPPLDDSFRAGPGPDSSDQE